MALFIVLNGLAAMADTAYQNVNASLLSELAEDEEDERAGRVMALLKKPLKLTFTNRIIGAVGMIGAGAAGSLLPVGFLPGLLIGFALVTVLGEFFFRKLALQHADFIALKFSGLQKAMVLILTPVTVVFVFIADLLLKLFRQETNIDISRYSEDEVMSILEAGQQSGEIKEEGKKMINSIFEFDDELAYEIMTPRTDVFMIDINDPPEEYMDELMELRYSRIPVCEDDSDNIIGILHIKDYLIKAREEGFGNVDIRSILRKPYFVPETKNIDSLFFELQKEKQHIAVLIDEYGGFSGIVTMEDIIEEVMGDIDDEFDEEEEDMITESGENTYIVSGKAYLDDLSEELGIELESENSETIGGLIFDILGEIPGEDDTNKEIRYNNLIFTILSVKERRIETVKIEILPDDDEQEDKAEDNGFAAE
ncbi:MAG: hemolysin family protein [Clostridia bacterium]|nr:hemolysin family protein [Clostridia bacterium]